MLGDILMNCSFHH